MRSNLALRRTRLSLKPPSLVQRALLSSTRVPRYPRTEPTRTATVKLSKRSSSSVTTPSADPTPEEPNEDNHEENDALIETEEPTEPVAEPAGGAADKPPPKPRRTRASTSKDGEVSSSLPHDLSILWLPNAPQIGQVEAPEVAAASGSALPPPEIFQEVLNNLHITLHPQTQHKAAYSDAGANIVEPTLALYCPIEGGDYVIDETVRELGRRTGAEVVVLDAVHLAAGECGHFGKAASVLQFTSHPLHFTSPPSRMGSAFGAQQAVEEEDDEDDDENPFVSSRVTLQLVAPSTVMRSGRAVVTGPRRPGSSLPKVKAFFEELINIPAPTPEGTEPTTSRRPPRIIYIRDFPTLASSSSSWYPALLAAVRSRRQGPLPRPSSPVHAPTTIIFGITPSIVAPVSGSSASSGPSGLVNLLMSRQNISQGAAGTKSGKVEYSETEAAEKARERRLRERLRRWERGDPSLHDELPRPSSPSGAEERDSGSGVILVGDQRPNSLPGGLPSMLAQALGGRVASRSNSPEDEKPARFFRTSVIVPGTRSTVTEKSCRIARRREINELTMRMGVASVGGSLPPLEVTPDDAQYVDGDVEPDPSARRVREEWGRTVEAWSSIRRIADRAVGKVISNSTADPSALWHKPSLDSVPVDWDTVHEAWTVHKASRDMRKAWIQHSSGKPVITPGDDDATQRAAAVQIDEVIERVKRDPELDQHEQRLLPCIVDTASISTTFNHVHLPARTIDSIRTIVSLPLLHPAAFQHGILKEHAMTGCLLFGPPGTGKTLVVRALAKEAGCRMMVVSPSDVMDMYVGEGEKLVRSVFSLARRLSPCVVFIDEIDALFGARMTARESGGAIAHRGVITEFMQEMDGLKSTPDDNVIVIGATNRPFDLDDAILRRLPRRLLVDLPGEKEREEILKILLRDEPIASDVDLKALARKTESFSGSDLKHLCVSAALDAVKEHVDVPWRPSTESSSVVSTDAVPPISTAVVTADEQVFASSEASTIEISTNAVGEKDETLIEADAWPLETLADAVESVSDSPAVSIDEEVVTTKPAVESVEAESQTTPATEATPPHPVRTLHWRNFTAALREITPSSSEALGTLADLRKWNEEFGEGRKDKKKQVWGKGRFGFTPRSLDTGEEGKVRTDTSGRQRQETTTGGP